MPLYELEDATLNGLAGQGYAYKNDDAFGPTYNGVFFPNSDVDDAKLEEALEAPHVEFTGALYLKTTTNHDTIAVDVTNRLQTGSGPRMDFASVDGIELELADDADEEE